MKNHITDLRDHLFATLEALRDKDEPMEIARAKAIANVAAQIVNSAKVENDYLRLTGREQSDFIEPPKLGDKPGTPEHPRLVKPLR